jgi:hydrogenase maturation protein HypF
MLPSAPLQHLLMHEMAGRPLVMTSGNRSDEPIAYEDLDAIERLGGIVDLFLTHNRPISVRCDDSVARVIGGQIAPIRRARGYAPASIALPHALPCPTLAVGGQLKSTFALGVGGNAFVSQHLGDLDHFAAYQAFERDVHLYENLIGIRPQLLVHDLHPDYASTRYAQARATRDGLRILPVQHHHAHIASGMAEHGLTGSVIGVAFDGTGYGTDGAIWGGEFLIADYKGFQRAAHLRYVGLPGADAAVRAPWRSALAYVLDADLETLPTGESALSLFAEIPADDFRTVRQMILRRFNSPLTSSMGRLFDAIAALAGIRTHVSYEGQAAIELEWLATGLEPLATYAFGITPANTEVSADVTGPQWIIDTRPLIRDVVQDVLQKQEPSHVARRFHSTVVEIVATVCERLRREWKLHRVVLSGGVFMNALLTAETTQRLVQDGFEVYSQQLVPANDGGLSLGQLAIAAASVEYAARVH